MADFWFCRGWTRMCSGHTEPWHWYWGWPTYALKHWLNIWMNWISERFWMSKLSAIAWLWKTMLQEFLLKGTRHKFQIMKGNSEMISKDVVMKICVIMMIFWSCQRGWMEKRISKHTSAPKTTAIQVFIIKIFVIIIISDDLVFFPGNMFGPTLAFLLAATALARNLWNIWDRNVLIFWASADFEQLYLLKFFEIFDTKMF